MSWKIRRLWKVSIFLIQEPLKKPKYVKFTLPPPKVEVSILSYIYIGLLYIKMKILTSGFQRLAQSVRKIEKSKKKKEPKGTKKSQNYKFLTKKMRKWVLVCLTEVACGTSNQRSCHDEFVDYEKTLLFYLGAKKSQNIFSFFYIERHIDIKYICTCNSKWSFRITL